MSRRLRFLLLLAILALVVARPSFRASEEDGGPAFELHRSSRASYFHPAQTNPMFALIIGSDVREGDPRAGRADAIQIVAIDTKRGRGTIVGIPRDSYVPIPGSGTNKINAALYFGGPERLVATVEQISGIKFHYWASVEFSRFRNLVDQLGGVDIDVPYKMADPFSGAFFDPGKRHMNGADALAFARNRKGAPGGDLGRSQNQGRLLLAGLRKFHEEARNPLNLARYFLAFQSQVATDVPPADLIDLALVGSRIDPGKVNSVVVPGSGGSAGGASVVHLAPGAYEIFRNIRDDAVL